MPWKEWSIVSQREEFVALASAGGQSVASLCKRFGISRETGHKWLRRHRAEGLTGLLDRSRRPGRPHQRRQLLTLHVSQIQLRPCAHHVTPEYTRAHTHARHTQLRYSSSRDTRASRQVGS